MKLFCLIILALLFLAVSVKAEIYTTPDGNRVEILLSADKDEIVLGEPVYLSLKIRNLSNKDIGFVDGGDYRNKFGRPDSFTIEVFDRHKVNAAKVSSEFNMGGLIGFRKIEVEGETVIRFLLPHWVKIEKPELYVISCRKPMVIGEFNNASVMEKINSPTIPVNVSTRLKVKAANSRELKKIIGALGEKILATPEYPDLEAVKMLSCINDAGVIKPFINLIEKSAAYPNAFYQVTFAFRTLSKFKNESAFEAIINQIASPEKNIRREVSLALSNSAHPKAGEYLLKMQNDSAWEIRHDVVAFLGKNKAEWATKVLRKMAEDENDRVSKEAKNFLAERGEKFK